MEKIILPLFHRVPCSYVLEYTGYLTRDLSKQSDGLGTRWWIPLISPVLMCEELVLVYVHDVIYTN